MICLFALAAHAKYSGGSGTAADPYQIATAADLIALGETPEDYDKQFILTADIDLDPNLPGRKVFDRAVIAPDTDAAKGGFQGTPFTGVLDGKGHTISHLTIIGPEYLGLFGRSAPGATVRNLGVVHLNITGSGRYVGGLAGANSGTVARSYSTGTVSGGSYVGGLAGHNGDTVAQCYSTATVNGGSYVGGLAGHNGATVAQCYSAGMVSGRFSVGGLVGENVEHSPSTVTGCFWDTQKSGQATSAAGTGKTTAQMQDIQTYLDASWDFLGEVTNGVHEIWQMPQGGGYPVLAIFNGYVPPQLLGLGTADEPYLISTALDLGAMIYHDPRAHYRLAASLDLSGICWRTAVIPSFGGTFDGNDHTISHLTITGGSDLGLFGCLDIGAEVRNLGVLDVSITATGSEVGGLVGLDYKGTVTRCYSTGSVTGVRFVGGLIGITDVDSWGRGAWADPEGLVTQCYSAATVSGKYEVGGLVGRNSTNCHVVRCHTSGAVNGESDVGGLVGYNQEDAGVGGCSSTAVVRGKSHVGGLVGWTESTVTECRSSGAVNGDSSVGGLVGLNEGLLDCSCSSGAVSGRTGVGGLTGINVSEVDNCYSTGPVVGTKYVGGLIGADLGYGDIYHCYSTGTVRGESEVGGLVGYEHSQYNSAEACFWDIQTSGQTISAGGTGKTTAEMQTASTFLDAWWEFVDEEPGDDYWWIDEGKDYPRLWWELTPEN